MQWLVFVCAMLWLAESGWAVDRVISATSSDTVREESEQPASALVETASSVGVANVLVLWPPGHIYPAYTADPKRPTFGLLKKSFSDIGIAESGDSRYDLKVGARIGVLRIHPLGQPERGWQIDVEASFLGEFDADHAYDNIGWDGIFGLMLTRTVGQKMTLRFGTMHTSSHVGDEYAERTGRRRINYTRSELVAGMSWRMARRWRSYAELGWAYDMRNDQLQEPTRVQLGLEYESDRSMWKGRLGWYAALDLAATEERDWREDTAFQLGLVTRTGGERRWRLGIERYKGRPPMGEFFQDTETSTALGLWFDL